MRTGDISYVYLMQSRQKVDATQGIASLIVASLIDLVLLIGLMIATATLLLSKLSGKLSWTVLYLTPLLIGTGLIILIILACVAPKFLCFTCPKLCQTAITAGESANHMVCQ